VRMEHMHRSQYSHYLPMELDAYTRRRGWNSVDTIVAPQLVSMCLTSGRIYQWDTDHRVFPLAPILSAEQLLAAMFIVVCTLSVEDCLPLIRNRILGVVVIDELPELRQMLVTFVEAGEDRLKASKLCLEYLLQTAPKCLFISAQMQDKDIEWVTEMIGGKEHKETTPLLLLDSNHAPRKTVTWRVKNLAHFRNLIAGFLAEGKKVVGFIETVAMTLRLAEWAERRFKGQGKVIKVIDR
jgi:hypothetical protein